MPTRRFLLDILENGYQVPSIIALLTVIALSVVISFILQYFRQRDAIRIAKANNAVNILHSFQTSEYARSMYSSFSAVEQHDKGALALLDRESDFTKQHLGNITGLLSHYEFVAIAIRRKALDETFCRELFGPTYVHRYRVAHEYIEKLRKGVGTHDGRARPTLYKHFEQLGKKWGR